MSSVGCTEETKFIYYIDEEETPYLVKLNISPDVVTLGDFKNALNRPHYKYFFKSIDDDFGVVKEEIFDDNATLPCFNGRVVSWLVTADGSTVSDSGQGDQADDAIARVKPAESASHPGVQSEPPYNGNHHTTAVPADSTSATPCTIGNGALGSTHVGTGTVDQDNESIHSANQDHIAPLRSFQNYKSSGRHHFNSSGSHCTHHNSQYASQHGPTSHYRYRHHHHRVYGTASGPPGSGTYETPSSMLSSDLESTSFFDSEDDSSRFSSITGTTLSSRRYGCARPRRRRRRPPPISRASSFSSITDSTMSLNIVAVTLNMDTVNFLGISIVGQSNKAGDGGIYVGSIMKGGAVAQDGRIEPGDMILEVNGISFEEMSNDDAVRTLREQVQRPGPITLVVAKCWDPNPRGGYFTIPRQEPVRPIDPRAWVLHTNAMTDGTAGSVAPAGQQNGTPITGTSSGGESSSTLSPSGGGAGMTPGLSMGTLTSGQTSMPLGTSAAAYNMAALLAATQQQQKLQQHGHPEEHLLATPPQAPHSQLSHAPFYPLPNMIVLPQAYATHVAPSVVTASSSLPEIERYSEPIPLTIHTDVATVIRAVIHPDSGLDIRDRIWLKLTVPNAFIGSDLVDWLYRHLDGFTDRRSARKYAANLLKAGYIRHTVNKTTFSEQCYYVFRDLEGHLSCLSLEEVDSVSEIGALPPPNWGHNTTSTNLTVAVPHSNTEYSATPGGTQTLSTAGQNHHAQHHTHNPNPSSGLGECTTGSGANSSQYSSVPPPAPPPAVAGISAQHFHPVPPPLAPPIQQLIADGQDAAAAAAMNASSANLKGSRVLGASAPRPIANNVSDYSTSSSSTDSDIHRFSHEQTSVSRGSKALPTDTIQTNFAHNSVDLHATLLVRSGPQHPPTPQFAKVSVQQQSSTTVQGVVSIGKSQSRTYNLGSVRCGKPVPDITASSTASSSTSEGPRVHRTDLCLPRPNLDDNQAPLARRSGASIETRGPQASAVSSKSSSTSSSTGSSKSNCTPLNSRHLLGGPAGHQHLRAANKSGSGLVPPPPPPPRISTALSGFTLTSRP